MKGEEKIKIMDNTKKELKPKNINESPETLAAVHTHTVYCLLVNRSNVKFEEYISKGRTMLFLSLILNNIGLSLCVFIFKLMYLFLYTFIIRAGPFHKK